MSVNRLNVLMTVMIAFVFFAVELGNAVNGYPKFNQRRLPQYLLNVPPQRYCGQKLSNTLETLCDGKYYSEYQENEQEEANTGHNFDYERNQDTILRENIYLEGRRKGVERIDYPSILFGNLPFMHRSRILRMLDGFGRTRRRYRRESQGVYEECCIKECTISELSSYCADPFQ